ncbi:MULTISPECIES: hypothetical protein [Chitinophaga]|uniref:Integron cassette protein VCH-CASS1 chain domain-containing protein n=1 Tax=Chitinophaga silvisoli TaxID=2291814 RepID=A0A3E1P394_9BACT|nr:MULTISPECIES: hypothetical protein [Chitinophaga]RFM34468.1 hypothetical protein DXN04_14420 [Chitinophaga silvisoli]WPV63999.1 hypothetical protein QQL36_19550 [Chitinophaga sp. LS1]
MATTIHNIEILRTYLSGVLDRANHHAQNVNEIALAIAGGIIWRTTDNIRVMSREGEMKNILWLQVGDRTLCFAYNHDTRNIEVREGSIQGAVVINFNNVTPLTDVKVFFENL